MIQSTSFAAVVAATILSAGIAAADSPYIRPDLKSFARQQLLQQAGAEANAAAVQAAAIPKTHTTHKHAQPLQISISIPTVTNTAFAAVRGPDGQLRYFPVEGGKEGLQTRVIVVHPGERISVQLPANKAR